MKTLEHYSRFRWVVLGLMLIVSMCSPIVMISFAPLMGDIAKDLGVSIGAASFGFMGLHMLAMAVGCAISGYLVDRFGVFPVINCGMVVLVISNASLPLLGHSYWPTVAIRIVEALGCAPVFVAIGPAVARWFPPREAGAALGLQSVAISAGIMVGLLASPCLVQSTGSWQSGVALLSVGLGVALVIVVAMGWMAKRHEPAVPVVASSTGPLTITKLWVTRPFLAGILGLSCGIWTQQAFNSLTPGYLAVVSPMGVGLGALLAGKLMTAVLLAGIVASLVGGILVDRVCGGRSRPVVLIGFALIAVCVFLLIVPQICSARFALIFCLVLTGAGTPFVNPVILGFAAKTFPPSIVGRVVGSWMSVAVFSGAAGVMVSSAALNSTGNYRLSMEIISAVAVVGFVAAFFIYPGKSDPASSLESDEGELSRDATAPSHLGSLEIL